MSKNCTVYFHNEDVEIVVEEGTDLRSAALMAEVDLYKPPFNVLNCKGNGLCGTCLCRLTSETNVNPPTFWEKAHSVLSLVDPAAWALKITGDYPHAYDEDDGYSIDVGNIPRARENPIIRLACQARVQGDVRVISLWPDRKRVDRPAAETG